MSRVFFSWSKSTFILRSSRIGSKLSEAIATCSTRPHGHSARSLQWTPQCTQLRGLSYTVDISGQTYEFEAGLLSERSLRYEFSQTIVAFSRRPHCHSPRLLQCAVDGCPTEVKLTLLISRVKRARLRPALRASVHYFQRNQKQSSLSRFIEVGTLRDHYGQKV